MTAPISFFMSMVYHHLGSPAAAARECYRVLRDGGYVCIRNGTRESDFPHRHFFALQPLIDSELPARAEIADHVRERRVCPRHASGGPTNNRSRLAQLCREVGAARRLVSRALSQQRISRWHGGVAGAWRQHRRVRSRDRRDRLVRFRSAGVARHRGEQNREPLMTSTIFCRSALGSADPFASV